MRSKFSRKIVSIDRVRMDRPKPYWAGKSHHPQKIQCTLTLECGHRVQRKSRSVTKDTKCAICEWCATNEIQEEQIA